jgi:hypothetical protein
MADFVTQHERQQIDELHKTLTAATTVDFCGIWKMIAPYWATVVSIVSKIPVIGHIIGSILAAVGAAMHACCPDVAAAGAGVEVSAAEQKQLHAAFKDVFGYDIAAEKPCCNIWKKVKKYWPLIISIVHKIPGVGPKLAEILKRLGDALDKFCG